MHSSVPHSNPKDIQAQATYKIYLFAPKKEHIKSTSAPEEKEKVTYRDTRPFGKGKKRSYTRISRISIMFWLLQHFALSITLVWNKNLMGHSLYTDTSRFYLSGEKNCKKKVICESHKFSKSVNQGPSIPPLNSRRKLERSIWIIASWSVSIRRCKTFQEIKLHSSYNHTVAECFQSNLTMLQSTHKIIFFKHQASTIEHISYKLLIIHERYT